MSAITPWASAAPSISSTGMSIVTMVTTSEGGFVLTVVPASWSAIAPGSARTYRLINPPNSGPASTATGKPMISE